MSLTWADYRTTIRRSILKDPSASTWSNDVLADICKWAQDTFCAHTALPTSFIYTSAQQEMTLPDNVFSDVETTGKLYFLPSDGSESVYLVPSLSLGSNQDDINLAFSVWGDTISLNAVPDAGTMKLLYFTFYPAPTGDSSLILIPRWALHAVAHLIGALAMTPEAVQSAEIDRWKDRSDSGYPDDNALRSQQQWMLKVYQNELDRFRRQDRENYYNKVIVP